MLRWGCDKWRITSINSKYKVIMDFLTSVSVHIIPS